MGSSAQYLANEEWTELRAAYAAHGSGPEFWQVYQELQQAAVARHGEARIHIVNELARAAEHMGAIHQAILV